MRERRIGTRGLKSKLSKCLRDVQRGTFEALREGVLFACFDERLRAAARAAGLNTWPEG